MILTDCCDRIGKLVNHEERLDSGTDCSHCKAHVCGTRAEGPSSSCGHLQQRNKGVLGVGSVHRGPCKEGRCGLRPADRRGHVGCGAHLDPGAVADAQGALPRRGPVGGPGVRHLLLHPVAFRLHRHAQIRRPALGEPEQLPLAHQRTDVWPATSVRASTVVAFHQYSPGTAADLVGSRRGLQLQ